MIAELSEFLDQGDIVIDGGNSLFTDTERRSLEMGRQFHFVGMGISGGEEGALWGPSPDAGRAEGGLCHARADAGDIAAKSEAGPCVTYIGPGGAGHYVKMVHNGIEYGDMQLIAETYDIMRHALGLGAAEIGRISPGGTTESSTPS